MKSWSIRARLTIWNGLVTVAVLIGFGVAAYVLMARTLLARTDGVLDFEFRETIEHLSEWDDDGDDELPEAFLEAFLLRITDAGGKILLESPKLAGRPLSVPAIKPTSSEPTFFGADFEGLGRYRVVAGDVLRDVQGRRVLIAVTLADYDREMADFRHTLLWALPIGILAALVGGYWSAGRALRPVHQMTETARNISEHNLRERLTSGNTQDELGRLADTLNHVFDRLAVSLDSARRFTADASHELMTPLATIRAEAEVALQATRTAEEHAVVLRSIVDEVERLSRLAGRMLLLARADAGTMATHFRPTRLDEVIAESAARIQPQALRAEVEVQLADLPPLTVSGDAELLRRVFDNLLDNAVKYNRPRGTVVIRAVKLPRQIVVEIEDSGLGILPESLPHIFERFYRAEASRSRKAGGAGLGLNIARTLVEAMGGRIEADSRWGKGSTFRLIFSEVDEI